MQKRTNPAATWVVALLLSLILVGIWWARPDRPAPPLPIQADEAKGLPVAEPSPSSETVVEIGVVAEADRPVVPEHESMWFLEFAIEAGEISLRRAKKLDGVVKPTRSLRGMSGIYFRSRSADGQILADGVIGDPRRVRYSFPETLAPDGTKVGAESGQLRLEQAEFVIRLPVTDRPTTSVELYSVSRPESERWEFALPENRLGAFALGAGVPGGD